MSDDFMGEKFHFSAPAACLGNDCVDDAIFFAHEWLYFAWNLLILIFEMIFFTLAMQFLCIVMFPVGVYVISFWQRDTVAGSSIAPSL